MKAKIVKKRDRHAIVRSLSNLAASLLVWEEEARSAVIEKMSTRVLVATAES